MHRCASSSSGSSSSSCCCAPVRLAFEGLLAAFIILLTWLVTVFASPSTVPVPLLGVAGTTARPSVSVSAFTPHDSRRIFVASDKVFAFKKMLLHFAAQSASCDWEST